MDNKWKDFLTFLKMSKSFVAIWTGGLLSMIGSSMSSFALGLWVYQQTNSITAFSIIWLADAVPGIIFSAVCGAIADRMDRRTLLILTDIGQSIVTLAFGVLIWTNAINLPIIYIGVALNAFIVALKQPTYMASVTSLVSKEHLARASGLQEMANSTATLISAALAGLLISFTSIFVIFVIDFLSYQFSLAALLLTKFSSPKVESTKKMNLFQSIGEGWDYLRTMPGLLVMLFFFGATNLARAMYRVLMTPMVLAFSSELMLGTILSVGSAASLLGGVLVSVLGGSKNHIRIIVIMLLVSAVAIVITGLQPNMWVVGFGYLLFWFITPFVMGNSQAIWQRKIAPAFQGRVFAMRITIAFSIQPIAYFCAGPLAENVFNPLLTEGGAWANTWIASLYGVGDGRGIGLIYAILGAWVALVTLAAWTYPKLRNLDRDIPDYQPPAAP